MQTKIYKMTKFGENRPISKQDQPFESGKIRKEMYVSDSVRMSIHFFVDFDVLESLRLTQNWPD